MDQFNQLAELLARPGTFVLAIVVVIATFFTKRIAEAALPYLKPVKAAERQAGKEVVTTRRYSNAFAMWWNEVVLYAVPVLYGLLFGLLNNEFLFGEANHKLSSRLMWSCGVAWFSSFLYKIVKKLVLQKAGVDIGPSSIAPPSGE